MEQKNTGLAAVAYIFTWLTGLIIYLVADKKDRYTRFHAFQSILLGVFLFVIGIVLMAIDGIISIFSFKNTILGALGGIPRVSAALIVISILQWVFALLSLGLIIYCIVEAYQGKEFELPIIGKIARKHVA